MKIPSIEKALQLYYEYTEIGTPEIRDLFCCGKSTARKLKEQAKEQMAKEKQDGKETRTWLPKNVDIKAAYKAWGIDVEQLEERLAKRRKLQSKGILI